ncbi:MAG: hypothetical protein FK731_08860 [Asgard group archaeon]|nr:hypothetical protein [Asgard group archaeon]
MSSFVVDNWPNLTMPQLIPEEFRVRHQLMIRSFEFEFQPVLSDIMPLTEAPDGGAQKFDWPVMTSPRPMAQLYDAEEQTRYLAAPAVITEHFSTRLTKAGFIRRFDEFRRDFTNNLISIKYQRLASEMVEAIQKRIEFEVANYLYLNTTAIAQYSTQDTSRALVANISSGVFQQADKTTVINELDSLLTGIQWHKAGSDVFRDFAAIKRAHEDMKGREITKAFFGPETCMWMDINSTVIDRLKYIKDTTDGVLGMTIQGITIKKVLGNDLKEASENVTLARAGAAPPMYPGLGDLDYDKWNDRNKVPIMVDGGTTGREWGIMSEDLAGRTFCSYVHELHERQARSATEPFTYEFAEQEPFRVKVRMERTFCPAIDDFANYVLVLNTVNRSDR